MARRPLLIGALVASVSITALVGSFYSDPGRALSARLFASEVASSERSAPPPQLAPPWPLELKEGTRATFRVSYATRVAEGVETHALSEPKFSFSFEGSWTVTVLEESAEGFEVAGRLTNVRAQAASPAAREQLVRELEREVRWIETKRGLRTQFIAPQGLDSGVKALLQHFIARTQVAGPETSAGAARSWRTRETEPAGELQAEYSRLEAKGRYRKRYLSAAGSRSRTNTPMPLVVASRTEFEIGADGALSTLSHHGLEVVHLRGDGAESSAGSSGYVTDCRIELKRTSFESGVTRADSSERWMRSSFSAAAAALAPSQAERDRQLTAGVRMPELLEQVRRAGPEADAARSAAVYKLAALARVDAAAGRELGRLLLEGARRDARLDPSLARALSQAGTAEAQAALTGALDASFDREVRRSAALALGAVEVPTQAAVGALETLSADPDPALRGQASLALGTSVNRIQATRPEDASRVTRTLEGQLSRATDPEETRRLLRALGNAAHPDALPSLLTRAQDPSTEVRAAALKALRLYADPRVDALLTTAMTRDPSAEVRDAAVFAASFRELDALIEALGQVSTRDPEASIRSAAIAVLGRALDGAEPEAVAPYLTWSREHDQDPRVRANATRLLGNAGLL
jgi:HEAT repeat protein